MSSRRPIPDSNILDLRELPPAQSPPSLRIWKLRRPRRPPPTESEPPTIPRDWGAWRREVWKFLVAGLIVIVPGGVMIMASGLVQAAQQVQADAQTGTAALQRGAQALTNWDPPAAVKAFAEAAKAFADGQAKLDQAVGPGKSMVGSLPVIGHKYRSAAAALTAGEALASAAQDVSTLLVDQPRPESISITDDGVLRGSLGFLTPLLDRTEAFRPILNQVGEASQALAEVDPRDVPAKYGPGVEVWQRLHPIFFGSDQRMVQLYDLLVELFASQEPREFLILFGNHDELRPTGGFPGTFLLVKFQAGTFTVLDAPVTGPYDLTTQNPKNKLPPQPLLAVAPYWAFQDAAWFLDAPTSSEFVLDFYEEARGFRPNGVMYVSPGVIEDLLTITGPIRPPGYGLDITAENFVRATELQVEFGYDKSLNNPKEFLLDLMPRFFERLGRLSSPDALRALVTTFDHAAQANFILTSETQAIASLVSKLRWDGQLLDAQQDYLAVVNTNLGGGKTDRVMAEDVRLSVRPENGRLQHEVTIRRKHTGDPQDILTSHQNRTFLRVYTPLNSSLVSLEGGSIPPQDFYFSAETGALPNDKLGAIEGRVLVDERDRSRITEESGRRVYGFWSFVNAGDSQTIKLTYTTPLYRPWTLLWQKQPGAIQRQWEVRWQGEDKVKEALPLDSQKQRTSDRVRWETTSDVHRWFSVDY